MLRWSCPPLLVIPTAALAEVCDKVAGETWQTDHGPIDAVTWPWALAAFATIGTSVGLIVWTRSRRLAWGAALFAALLALLGLANLWMDRGDLVTIAAVQEGCLSPNQSTRHLIGVGALGLLAALYVRLARKSTLVR
jgi:hypothetical protein